MLCRITDTGKAFLVDQLYKKHEYDLWVKSFDPIKFGAVSDYVAERIAKVPKQFSVATEFGGTWTEPLTYIYEACKQSEEQAAFALGKMVIDHLIRDDSNWCCTKSDLTGREFSINVYWRE